MARNATNGTELSLLRLLLARRFQQKQLNTDIFLCITRIVKLTRSVANTAEDLAATMLASTLGVEFNPSTAWDEREKIYKMSGGNFVVRTFNITQSAEGEKSMENRILVGRDGSLTPVNSGAKKMRDDKNAVFHLDMLCLRCTFTLSRITEKIENIYPDKANRMHYSNQKQKAFEDRAQLEFQKLFQKEVPHCCVSGKGGVGKTTVAVNLAHGFQMKVFLAAIRDGDITRPKILNARDKNVRRG